MYGSGLVEGKDLGVVKSEAKGKRKIGDRERGLEQEKKPPLEKMTMESNTVPDLTNYAVMVLQNGESFLCSYFLCLMTDKLPRGKMNSISHL